MSHNWSASADRPALSDLSSASGGASSFTRAPEGKTAEAKINYALSEGKSSQPNRQSSGNASAPVFDRTRFSAGQLIDVKDDVGVWCEAEIVRVQTAQPGRASKQQESGGDDDENDPLCVYIHFIYWGEEFDEYIECSSERLAARGSHTFLGHNIYADTPGSRLRIGQRVDALDIHPQNNNWITASIVEISEDESRVKLHWFNYHVKFDEWVNARSTRIRPYGSRQKRNHPDWRRHQLKSEQLMRQERQGQSISGNANLLHESESMRTDNGRDIGVASHAHLRRASNSQWAQHGSVDPRFTHYRHALLREGLLVIGADGDGNCLFRSVSRQMYGSEDHHAMIRAAAWTT